MTDRAEYLVVVTAAAPFKENETNPTQDVKAALPDRIERPGLPPIKIIKFHYDTRNVITDMEVIAKLWNQDKKVYFPDSNDGESIYIDAILHMGMNFSNEWRVERRARRDGYDWVGDDGVRLPKDNGGPGGMFEGKPEILTPMFDVDEIVERIHRDLPDLPAGGSTDAGLKYCELILYVSLAALHERNEPARAIFMHHPGKKAERHDIEQSAKVAVSIISSMVEQLES